MAEFLMPKTEGGFHGLDRPVQRVCSAEVAIAQGCVEYLSARCEVPRPK